MPKSYLILPQTEMLKFKAWTDKLTEENKRQCQSILYGTAQRIRTLAMRAAPVNFNFLRNSIKVFVTPDRMGAEVTAGGQSAGAYVRYAPYVEFGTGDFVSVPSNLTDYALQFKGRGLRKVNNRARPYFFPAVETGTKEMIIKLNQMGFK